ncbi:DUF2267 domain-containing protein [Cylindrospermum sp. FACHB-282]|uniref:DUF2267 domain-containing protein n=1 Tax=Cylindrospermum sp. FACHB-282 TaxID=2692794 RepID=UPI001684A012|nr:DUF2267 domain-containing protein [Cylindrospermum sp. FACHB-282]MBD2387966.1 DUF2267 domain-containing protein [Cylindrospermum sp. FACHB-282]
MPITIREDVAYILLKKINDTGQGMHEVNFTKSDFPGREITIADFLGHLDYLNQQHYINAEFTGNAYANQEDVPDLINPEEFDLRIANTYGAPDGPLPHLITFKKAELREKGREMLKRLESNPPPALEKSPSVAIARKDMPFLQKVKLQGGLEDIFDARDVTEVVFRTMRDMMTNEAADHVAAELHKPADGITDDKALQNEIADLWKDTNPIVAFLSRVRPPLIIKSDTFLFRISQEASLKTSLDIEMVVKAVFSATKDELSKQRIQEISQFLPDKIRQLWEEA